MGNEQQSHPPPSLFLSISSDIYQSVSLPLTRGHGIECNPVGTPEKPKRRREDNSNRRPTNWPPTIRLCFVSVARFIFFCVGRMSVLLITPLFILTPLLLSLLFFLLLFPAPYFSPINPKDDHQPDKNSNRKELALVTTININQITQLSCCQTSSLSLSPYLSFPCPPSLP